MSTVMDEGVIKNQLNDALLAHRKACSLRGDATCPQADALLDRLRVRCKQTPLTCGRLGSALLAIDVEDEADTSFDRACQAGDADACLERAQLHDGMEPEKVHAPLTEKALDRGCSLNSQSACCNLVAFYARRDKPAAENRARARLDAVIPVEGFGIACDVFSLGGGKSGVRAQAKAEGEGVPPLSKADRATLEEILSRRLGQCFREPPAGPVRLELEWTPNHAAKLVSFSVAEGQTCADYLISQIHLGNKPPGRAIFTVTFPPKTSR